MHSFAIGHCVVSSGVDYVVRVVIDVGVVATCTPRRGRAVVLDVLAASNGPIVFRSDSSRTSRELAAYVTRWLS